MTVKELLDIVNKHYKELGDRIESLKTNDLHHLDKKVDKLTWIAGVGVGIMMALQVVLHVLG